MNDRKPMASPTDLEQLEQLARSGATGPWMNEKILQLLADRRELVAGLRRLLRILHDEEDSQRASIMTREERSELQALAASMGET